jgi:predicted CopG family antitoxin
MYYITFNNKTKRVTYIGEKKPISISNNLTLAEVDTIPEKYDYLTVVNEREKTDTWVETIEEYNEETSEVIEKEVERSRTFVSCDIVAHFKPQPTLEEIEKQKEKEYKELCEKYIREKYSQSDVEAIINNYLENSENEKYKNEFDELQNYRKECKAKAKLEVYGV